MSFLLTLFAVCVGLHTYLAVAIIPYALRRDTRDVTPLTPTWTAIQRDLGPLLSPGASIYFPGNPLFANSTARWNAYGQPNISVVVQPGNDDDVAATVVYANKVHMPFLAVNRGHGSANTFARMRNGISIHIRALDSISIASDGNSALAGGGVYDEQLIQHLSDHGKISATGACGCVGVMGAGLGGGYGRVQGYYGLVADNMIDANVVLANGSQVNVSATSHPDLWWGLRGAGPNFGIVTRFNYKIYDNPVPTWYYAIYYYTQNKLEDVFTLINTMSDNTIPKEIGNIYVNYAWYPNASTTEPVIVVTIDYIGTKQQAAQYTAPFLAFGPVVMQEDTVPYTQIAAATGTGTYGILCAGGSQRMQFAAGLLAYNVTANRAVYNLYKNITTVTPAYQGSVAVFESYSLEGVKAVDPASTSFPHRADNILFTLVATYAPDPKLDAGAIAWGEQSRGIMHDGEAGRPLTVYLNYAFGNENLQEVYGYEPWRLERLRALKKAYDPHNKFRYYMPITQNHTTDVWA